MYLTDIAQLKGTLPNFDTFVKGYTATKDTYCFRLTEYLADLLVSKPSDALLKQFLPSEAEMISHPDEHYDVGNEKGYTPLKGIVRKYPTKLLFLPTLECPAYCRFCFRKEVRNIEGSRTLTRDEVAKCIEYINRDTTVSEVVFSGGDPFFLPDARLQNIVERVSSVQHIKIVRLHTRVLTYDPTRLLGSFTSYFSKIESPFFVFQVNHPDELTSDARKAAAHLHKLGIMMFSHTTLLKDINDDHQTLLALFQTLLGLKIKPYYLFHSDPGKGLRHFRVPLKVGISLFNSLFNRISGLALPTYIFNIPGGHGHMRLDLGNLEELEDGTYELRSWEGKVVPFSDKDL